MDNIAILFKTDAKIFEQKHIYFEIIKVVNF